MMLKIYEVHVAVRNPTGDDPRDKGAVEVGFYQVDGDILTMCDAGGAAVRNSAGERITARLLAGDQARRVAYRLTLARWRSDRNADELVPGFNDPIRYPREGGWA